MAFNADRLTVPDGGQARLVLFNNTTTELLLTARVTPGDAFEVETAADSVIPGGAVAVRISDVGADAGGRGRVDVVAVGGGGNAGRAGGVARAEVTVGSPTAPAEPLVSEWSVTSYRFKPWGGTSDNGVLPLLDAAACDEVALRERAVGGVWASPGAARVVASCSDDGAPGSRVGAELAFPGLAHHTGDYRGEIDLAPGDGSGAVALTVRRTDYVIVPLAVVLAGVLAAVAVARRLGRLDARAGRERDAWLLLAEVDDAHRAFAARARDTVWSGYSFKVDADRRVRAVLGELREPAPGPAAGRDRDGAGQGAGDRGAATPDADGGSAAGRLEPVARAAAAWPLLADRLAELDVAVTEVALKAASHRPPTIGSNEPVCLAAARSLLTGRRLAVEEALELAGAVDAAATMTGGWLDWATTVAELESRTELLALAMDDLPSHHEDQQRLAEARSKLSEARVGLWEAPDLADLDDRETLAAVGDARVLLDGLDHHMSRDLGPADEVAGLADLLPPSASSLGAALAAGRRPSRPAGAARARARDRWRSAIALSATGLVATWSGLEVLYFDQAFGTPRDYVGIFVWGFALQAALTVVVDRLAPRVAAARPAA